MNLLEQQASNRRRTVLVMVLFVLFFVLLGMGFDAFMIGSRHGFVPIGGLVALGVGSASAAVSYFQRRQSRARLGPRRAARCSWPKRAGEADKLKFRQLQNVVDEMAIASGLPRPHVYVVPDEDPNAFATGRDPEHASLAVTRGLLDVARPRRAAGASSRTR